MKKLKYLKMGGMEKRLVETKIKKEQGKARLRGKFLKKGGGLFWHASATHIYCYMSHWMVHIKVYKQHHEHEVFYQIWSYF